MIELRSLKWLYVITSIIFDGYLVFNQTVFSMYGQVGMFFGETWTIETDIIIVLNSIKAETEIVLWSRIDYIS